jgi:hypothetical protein
MKVNIINTLKLKLTCLSAILLVLLSCEKNNNMEIVTVENDLPVFDEIILHSVFFVYLVQDSVYSLKITGHEDFVKNIDYYIEDKVLNIKNASRNKWLRPKDNKVSLYISTDSLKKITAGETCYIETINAIKSDKIGLIFTGKLNQAQLELDCNTFFYWNNFPCGGRLTLTGKSKNLRIWNYALMAVDASNLSADDALVENSSQGVCKVRVKNTLEYSIYGEGDIYLYGTPNQIIEGEITSSGTLVYK